MVLSASQKAWNVLKDQLLCLTLHYSIRVHKCVPLGKCAYFTMCLDCICAKSTARPNAAI